MASQHGVVTRAQALAAGLGADDVRRLVRSGQWRAVRQGHYVARELWEDLDPYVGRPQLEARVAWMGLRKDYALSHDSAAVFQGIATLSQPAPLIHVTRLGPPRARTRHGIKRHQSRVVGPHLVHLDVLSHGRGRCSGSAPPGTSASTVALDVPVQLDACALRAAGGDDPGAPARCSATTTGRSRAGTTGLAETINNLLVVRPGPSALRDRRTASARRCGWWRSTPTPPTSFAGSGGGPAPGQARRAAPALRRRRARLRRDRARLASRLPVGHVPVIWTDF